MIQYEITVTGRVQGVWFRKFTEEKANELGVKGWVKNTPDGNVLIVAQTDKQTMDTFIDYLKIGSPMSKVNEVITSPINGLADFNNFTIKY